ncbi:hypothetical protein DFH09DRAFT_1412728 [Mycena vulgaris]|nr:hypothetical protein DFH09DRAFT_1412728 [Mycena vulgaris]
MDPLSEAPPGVRIVEVSGPLVLGYLLPWGLFGTLSVQLYLYYQAFPTDKWSTKCLVYTAYTLELVHTILSTHDAFAMFGYGFADPSALTEVEFSWLAVPIMSGLVAFIGQSFYAYRVHVLSKSWFIPILIVVVSLTSSVGAFILGAFVFQAGSLAPINHRKSVVATAVWCGASALSDIIIAFKLSKYDMGFRQTRALVSKVVRLTIETGSLTALVALTTVTLFLTFPDRDFYATPAALMPTLYANSILVILNARIQINSDSGAGVVRSNPNSRPSHVVTLNREAFSDGDVHHHVEMKVMAASDLAPYV